uniref:Uncharacterized protein n=1 Tax=Anguilla anguilla TaxID=7936 RepID=A0A0E9WEA1_ANGAN
MIKKVLHLHQIFTSIFGHKKHNTQFCVSLYKNLNFTHRINMLCGYNTISS